MLVEDILPRLQAADPRASVVVQVGPEPLYMTIIGVMTYGEKMEDTPIDEDCPEQDDCGQDLRRDTVLIRVD